MAFKVTWLGHGSFELDIDDTKILLDPYLTDNPAASASADSFEKVDYILVSHGHGDHIGDTIDIAKRTGAMVIANAEISGWLRGQGLDNVHAQHIGGGYQHHFGYVKLTIAHHGSGLPDGSYGGNPAGFLITTITGETVYFACDTGLFYEMKLIGKAGIDLAFLPIGDNFTMGPDDAFRAVKFLKPTKVVPVHFNTWPLIAQDGKAWVKRINKKMKKTEAMLMQPGESITLGE